MSKQKNKEFIELYNPIHDKLWRFCLSITGNRPDAEDLLQDTVLNAMQNLHSLKNEKAFLSFTFSIASNLYKMQIRRNKFKGEFSEKEVHEIVDLGQNQEYLADFKIVYGVILALPERIKETLLLFYISDLPIKEIQKIQGGSLSGVKERLRRGRIKVLNMLNDTKHIQIAMMIFI